MYKKFLLVMLFVINFIIFADENDINSLKFRKEKTIDLEIYFPKKIPDYLDTLMNSKDIENLYEIAKIYLILGKNNVADKYILEYEKKSKNLLNIAKYYYIKGETEIGDKYLLQYVSNLSFEDKIKYHTTLKDMIKKYGIIIDETKIFISNLDVLLYTMSDAKFVEVYENIFWSDEEKKIIAEHLKYRDLEKNEKLKKIFYSIANQNQVRDYYYNRIKSNTDIEGYNLYFLKGENGEYQIEFKNLIEKLIYLKYKKEYNSYNEILKLEKEKAILEKDYEKLYILSKIDYDNNIKEFYNLGLQSDKYLYLLLKDIENGKMKVDKGSQEWKSLIDAFISYYPTSKYIDEIYIMKADTIEDLNEKKLFIDEILSKKFIFQLFTRKLNVLNSLQQYKDCESLARNFLEKNYPFSDVVQEFIFAMEKQDKQKELLSFLDTLVEKGYYYTYLEKIKSIISNSEKENLAEYYFRKKDYEKLMQFKNILTYEQFSVLIDEGRIEFKEWASQKFPFEKRWNDFSKQQYILFNENFDQYNEETVKKLINKTNKSDAEKYYLARYYEYKGEYKKSIEIFEELVDKYKIYKEIISSYINVLMKSGDNNKVKIVKEKYNILFEW